MNEQLQQALAAILNKTMAGVEAGVSFLGAELPDVIQQLLVWKLAEAGMTVGVSLGAALALTRLARGSLTVLTKFMQGQSMYYNNSGNEAEREGKRQMHEYGSQCPWAVVRAGVSAISWLVVLMAGLPAAQVAVQIWLAPKIYLIEYAASLAK
jgi:hypothetical protein